VGHRYNSLGNSMLFAIAGKPTVIIPLVKDEKMFTRHGWMIIRVRLRVEICFGGGEEVERLSSVALAGFG
jgi:hypothetical protein